MSLKHRRGQAAQSIVVTFIIAAILLTGLGYFLASLATNYPSMSVSSKPEYNAVMANVTAIYGQTHSVQNVTEGIQENPNAIIGIQDYGPLVNAAFGVIGFIQALFTALASMTGLPVTWVVNFLVLLTIAVIAFSVLNWLRGSMRGL